MPAQVKLYIVRHADAGSRSAWTGDDDQRPLSKKGRRQAAQLVETLTGKKKIARLVASPSVRCIETLGPLAERTGLPVETDRRLAEGSRGDDALALADEVAALEVGVLCTHGDVIPDLLSELRIRGTTFHHDLTWPKGSVWMLSSDGTAWTDADLLTAP
ncbi:MAG TPA: phosphoglycerate mutase family protein [Acidimicrobiales bacterium]|jgi:8-oxo-dGTP diphosphatase|nr:phosphoglycerate mutase family protein [Acidimicrobiales bacterium]